MMLQLLRLQSSLYLIIAQASWDFLVTLALLSMPCTSNHVPVNCTPFRWISREIGKQRARSCLFFSIAKPPLLPDLLEYSIPQYLCRISYSLYIVHFPIPSIGGWPLLPWDLGTPRRESWRFGRGYVVRFLVSPLWSFEWQIYGGQEGFNLDESYVTSGRWIETRFAVAESNT